MDPKFECKLIVEKVVGKNSPGLETEYRFHPKRRWRFDHAIPSKKLAIEYEGIFSMKSRHLTVTGYSNDCEKYGQAAILGWVVIRVTPIMIKDGRAETLIRDAFKGAK